MKQLPAAVRMKLVVPNLIHFTFIFKFAQLKYRLKFSSGTSCLGVKCIFSEILTTVTRKINEKLLGSVTHAKRPVRDLCVFPNQLLSGCWLSWKLQMQDTDMSAHTDDAEQKLCVAAPTYRFQKANLSHWKWMFSVSGLNPAFTVSLRLQVVYKHL